MVENEWSETWDEEDGILTAIDESVIVLSVGFVAVTTARELHRGNSFGTSMLVIRELDAVKGSNRGLEKFL